MLFKISTIMLACSMLHVSGGAQEPNAGSPKPERSREEETVCGDSCSAKNESMEMSCKLTTPELRERKETVIASLKQQIIEKKELKNGFAFKFQGTDKVLDELTEFMKTERACCAFFTFGLSVSGDQSEAWLELTGPAGVKAFITAELGF